MFGWLKAQVDRLAGSRSRPLSLVANWLANVLWLIDTTFLGLAQKAYGSNAVVYACLRLLSQSVPEAPLLAYTVTGDTEAELPAMHPLRMLIAKPNEMMTEYEFWELVTLQMGISGRSVWFKERDNAGHIIGLWPLRPDRVGPIYASPTVASTNGDQPAADNKMRVLWGYAYNPPGGATPIPIPRNDIIAFNFPNPGGESGGIVEGLGPTQVLAHEISADNEATDFVGALLANSATPSIALKVKAPVRDEAQAQLIKAQFRQEFGGARRGMPAILDADTDIQQIGFNLRQLEFPDVRANAESRICAAFGVPAILVGVKVGLDRSTFSNMREARQFFAETTLSNYWRRYRDQYQNDVVVEFGDNIRVEFNTAVVRALAPRREQELAIAERAFTLGATTRNEYRAVLGLALVEGGDVFLVGAQTLAEPAGEPIKARVLDPPLLTAGDSLKKASDPREADEAALRVALEKLFGGFSDDMVGRIRRGEGLPEDELRAELGRLLEPRLVEIAVAEGMRQGQAVGVSFDLPVVNDAAVAWARDYTYDLVGGLVDTTRAGVQNAIARFYETPGMTRAELEAILAPTFGPLRAEMIAITEVTRAYSAAQADYQQMLAAQGIDMERVWVTRADELTCPLCSALNGKTEDAWDSGAPPRHVRCRCGSVLRRRERVAVPAGAGERFINADVADAIGSRATAVFRGATEQALFVDDFGSGAVMGHLDDISKIPPDLLKRFVDSGGKIRVGNRGVAEFPGEEHWLNIRPRGWPEGSTYKDIAGMFDEATGMVIAGRGQHGSVSLLLHEFGHGVGWELKINDMPELVAAHRRIFLRLNPYFQQGGPGALAGREEFLAESIAERFVWGRENIIRRYDRAYVDWLEKEVLGL